MNQKSKYPTISVRIEPEYIRLLEQIAKHNESTISSVVRQMIIAMVYNYQKGKTESVENPLSTIFEVMDIDSRAVSKLHNHLLTQKEETEKLLIELANLKEKKVRAEQGLF